MRLTILLMFTTFVALGQEVRYFTPYFQHMVNEKTEQERRYHFEQGHILVEDYKAQIIEHKASISGLTDIEDINAWMAYCISQGHELLFQEPFEKASATFQFYSKGKLYQQLIVDGSRARIGQVWDAEGQEILVEGSGEHRYFSEEMDEDRYENYQDSVLISSYGIRTAEKDTIYYHTDQMPGPKDGLPGFYRRLSKALKYPGIARLAGKEGHIYVAFIVNENGRLSDFRPLTKEGYRFETKTIRILEKFPDWNPALFENRPVKTKIILPVTFKLTD